MARRTLTALLLLALIVPAIYSGGILYFALAAAFILLSAWEYVQLFRLVHFQPSLPVTLGGTLLILLTRAFWPEQVGLALAASIGAALAAHLLPYERGRDQAALDFAITLAGFAYLGWFGAYILDLRALPDGAWWTMLIFPVVWLADSGAYMIGSQYGRHKMLPRLSPNKTWEGYAAGVVGGALAGAFFAFAYSSFGPLRINLLQGALLGCVLGAVTPLGDLGESLIKRFAGQKDSGSFFPGHGGAFDRIDSLIWAAVIGYYWIFALHV